MAKRAGVISSRVAVTLPVASSGLAMAKSRKLTLDQAWAVCKAEIDRTIPRDQHSHRYSGGVARVC
jgi:hypothetical protein